MRPMKILAIAGTLYAAPASASTDIFSSFDEAGTGGLSSGQTIDGWTVVGDGQSPIFALAANYAEGPVSFNSNSGASTLDITGAGNAGPTSGIYRDVLTDAGRSYDLAFFLGASYLASANLELFIDGASAGVFTNDHLSADSVDWQRFEHTFIAAGSTTRVAFMNANPQGNNYAGFDDVSVTPSVPEPATWAMMTIGFGLVGASMRRRQVKTTVTYA